MKYIIDIPETKICPFCGIEFDKELMKLFNREDRPDNNHVKFGSCKYCSLWCTWLSDPSIYHVLENSDKHNISDIKDKIAERVAKNILMKNKIKRVMEMKNTVADLVYDRLDLENHRERWIDVGRREVIKVICNEKRRHTPNSGAGRILTSLLILLGEQEDY